MKDISMQELKNTATQMRMKVIDMIYKAQSGHPGGSLSAADFVTACYFKYMNLDPKNPRWEDRDRMVLSKGHVCPIQYACLATVGFFPESVLDTLRKEGSMLQGHPSMNRCPGIDISTGSLGQGLACAAGMALAGKRDKKDYRVFVMVGDGELDEGQIWEAAMAASAFKADNLVAIVDRNGLQANGKIKERMDSGNIAAKFLSFGWHVIEIDGHNMEEILTALDGADQVKGVPTVIVADTVKGKGLSFAENVVSYHNGKLTDETYRQALAELAV